LDVIDRMAVTIFIKIFQIFSVFQDLKKSLE
jgi:hypothetical protein